MVLFVSSLIGVHDGRPAGPMTKKSGATAADPISRGVVQTQEPDYGSSNKGRGFAVREVAYSI